MDKKVAKKTLGRRKIEIKKIEKKTNRQVTFTKRRAGLFRKASELSIICGAEIAILVQSPADKIFAFGHPSVEYMLDRFQTGSIPSEFAGGMTSRVSREIAIQEESRSKYKDAARKLEMVKLKVKEEKERTTAGSSEGRDFWWDADLPFDLMELHELEEYVEGLESLRDKILLRVEEMDNLAFLKSEQTTKTPSYGGESEQYFCVGGGQGMTTNSDLDMAAMLNRTATDQSQTAALSEAISLPPFPDMVFDNFQ